VKGVKEKQKEIGRVIDHHNVKLDRIDHKIDKNHANIKKNNHKIQLLLD
jgi:hypothetical protein